MLAARAKRHGSPCAGSGGGSRAGRASRSVNAFGLATAWLIAFSPALCVGCTVQQLWKLLEGNLPPEVLCLSVALKQQVMAQLRARPDIELKPGIGATRNDRYVQRCGEFMSRSGFDTTLYM